MIAEPALYTGHLRHRRFRPTMHEFRYSLFMVMLDLEHLEETLSRSSWTGHNRFRWASFHDRDHFGDPALPWRERLSRDAAAHGLELPRGPIFLLTQLRYLGYCFNPLSFYYCCDESGTVRQVMAEVNSTFGESVNYWLHEGNRAPDSDALRYRTAKRLHVSPFMPMDQHYEFALNSPGDVLTAHIANQDASPLPLFDATLTLQRQAWTAANLRRTLLRHPCTTAKTIAAIHFEAARLFLKRTPFYPHPAKQTAESGHASRPTSATGAPFTETKS